MSWFKVWYTVIFNVLNFKYWWRPSFNQWPLHTLPNVQNCIVCGVLKMAGSDTNYQSFNVLFLFDHDIHTRHVFQAFLKLTVVLIVQSILSWVGTCVHVVPPPLSLSLSLTIRISFACYIKHPTSCPISFHWLYNPDLLVAGIGYGLRKRTYTVRLNASWFVMQTDLNFICDIWRRLDI